MQELGQIIPCKWYHVCIMIIGYYTLISILAASAQYPDSLNLKKDQVDLGKL